MKAIVFTSADSASTIKKGKIPVPGPNEVVVNVKAASLNRRDFWIKKGIYQGARFPCIAGSDGSGLVEKTGSEVDPLWKGKEVIINPALNWGPYQHSHGDDFNILGLPGHGTFAQYVCVPAGNLYEKPQGWSFEKASALPLAGLTAYRALFYRGNLQKGQKILITGTGGGVAVFLVQFAVAAGAEVFVSSGSEKKIKKAVNLGAQAGVLYNEPGWDKKIAEIAQTGFDLIVDSAAGRNFEAFPGLLKTGGKIVIFGGTAGKIPELTAAKIFWKQASILGTTMGSPMDFEQMLAFVKEHKIEPVIDKIFPMIDSELAFKQMENHEQFGKIVIRMDPI